jgi:hypothetical protein
MNQIYHLSGEEETDKVIDYDQLEINAVIAGYNQAFGGGARNRQEIVKALTYVQVDTPDARQKHRFELDWSFRDLSGRTIEASATDFGPGVGVFGASRADFSAEINQAFALTFLELVVQLDAKISD